MSETKQSGTIPRSSSPCDHPPLLRILILSPSVSLSLAAPPTSPGLHVGQYFLLPIPHAPNHLVSDSHLFFFLTHILVCFLYKSKVNKKLTNKKATLKFSLHSALSSVFWISVFLTSTQTLKPETSRFFFLTHLSKFSS